jgi:hypothetical protein
LLVKESISLRFDMFKILRISLYFDLKILNLAAPKLVQILATLPKDEWPSLKKNILHHTSETSDLFKIFKYMMDHREQLSDIIEIEPIVEKSFKKLGTKVFLNHLSTLYQYTESWLVNEQLNFEDHTFQLILHRALNKRGLYHQANQIADKLEKSYKGKQLLIDLQTLASIYHQSHYSYNPIKYENGAQSFTDVV